MIDYDRAAYKRRNLIERCVNRLKQFRRVATRYRVVRRKSARLVTGRVFDFSRTQAISTMAFNSTPDRHLDSTVTPGNLSTNGVIDSF
jgi:transposase